LALAQGDSALAATLREEIAFYQADLPFREVPK
jgi:hypothetical protein